MCTGFAKPLVLAALAGGIQGLSAGAAPAHDFHWTIDNCACDASCYTDEVRRVDCDGHEVRFRSKGLPSKDHTLMTGIEASNQQFPRAHDFTFTITLLPRRDGGPAPTEAGPIGVAVNGVPLFDPSTQGPVDPRTGKRPSAYREGELDECGGHAGRGDDYHYHIAPKCLIDDLGRKRVEETRQPIGFAMDGHPILALGWFDPANDIEKYLDDCRGASDAGGRYFYNVKHEPDWDILNCFAGKVRRNFAHDDWTARKDAFGADITGIPIKFAIDRFDLRVGDGAACQVMTGTLADEQLLRTDGDVDRVRDRQGSLFYCNPHCYGQFLEADRKPRFRGRVLYFERYTDDCPAALGLASLPMFEAYEGPPQTRKGPPGTGKEGPRRGPPPPRPGGERP